MYVYIYIYTYIDLHMLFVIYADIIYYDVKGPRLPRSRSAPARHERVLKGTRFASALLAASSDPRPLYAHESAEKPPRTLRLLSPGPDHHPSPPFPGSRCQCLWP